MSVVDVPAEPVPVKGVGLRVLPWRPRWRTGRSVDPPDVLDLADLFDDPLSAALGLLLLVLLLPFVLAVVLGVALLSVEMLALLPLGLLLLAGRLLRLRPWVLVVRYRDGRRELVEVHGVRRAWQRRRALLGR